jgi:hypothetical protein
VTVTQRTAVVVTAALLAACGDPPAPTGVDPGALGPHTPEIVLVASLPGALIPVEDALNRVLEVLPDHPAKALLGAALGDLAAALDAGDSCGIRTSRREAEHALRDLSRGQPDEFEADFDVVKLALGAVEQTGRGRC